MEDQKIIQYNKLIAEFMGAISYPSGNSEHELYEFPETFIPRICPKDMLIFHSSWDWLMPVVEKIYFMKIASLNEEQYALRMTLINNIKNTLTNLTTLKTENTHREVVKFIEWYNKKWVCTDPSCNQYRFKLSDTKYLFKEDRTIDPLTNKTEIYESEIDLDEYTLDEIIGDCETFGYTEHQVNEWLSESKNLDLIAECIFELES